MLPIAAGASFSILDNETVISCGLENCLNYGFFVPVSSMNCLKLGAGTGWYLEPDWRFQGGRQTWAGDA